MHSFPYFSQCSAVYIKAAAMAHSCSSLWSRLLLSKHMQYLNCSHGRSYSISITVSGAGYLVSGVCHPSEPNSYRSPSVDMANGPGIDRNPEKGPEPCRVTTA